MQFQSSDCLSHHGIWDIIHVPCSPNNGNCTVCSKLKTSWKSVVFKAEKNSQYFVGVFKKAIIIISLCLLLDMRMIIAYSVLCTSLAIYHRAVTKSRAWVCSPATMSVSPDNFCRKQNKNRTKRTSFLYNSPSTNCIDPATWNFSDSPAPSNIQCALVEYSC